MTYLDVLPDMLAHAERDYPRESCGVVCVVKGRRRYLACRNIAERNEHFVIDPVDYAAAEDAGEVVAIVHSHCNLPPVPSQADRVGCESSGLPWVIVSWPSAQVQQFTPCGYRAPLVGREFLHGVLDCYALVRDYYAEALGLVLTDYARDDEWWLKNQNLYLEHFEREGFVVVTDAPRQHDAFLMQVASQVPNHAAVYLGEGVILHHVMGRLSSRDVYGGWWQKVTTHHLRHRSKL
jgi:proteasome lid subunit RPN8/RPN11